MKDNTITKAIEEGRQALEKLDIVHPPSQFQDVDNAIDQAKCIEALRNIINAFDQQHGEDNASPQAAPSTQAPPAAAVPSLASVLDAYEQQTKALPGQHEIPGRGCSTYNWQMAVIRDLRAMLKQAPPAAADCTHEAWESMPQAAGVQLATPSQPAWKPIETAPKNNARPLYLARFIDDQLVEIDFNGAWEYDQENWETPQIQHAYWVSENGIEEPTHWAFQDKSWSPKCIEALRNLINAVDQQQPISTCEDNESPQATSTPSPFAWNPIETAPKNNARPLYLARFIDGQLVEIDFNGAWEYDQESWELPHIQGSYWGSQNGIEEPTHWAFQDKSLPPPSSKAP